MKIKYSIAFLVLAACGSSAPLEPDVDPESEELRPYEPCDSDDDCGALDCVNVLGTSVCARTGCAQDEALCNASETCVVSAAVNPEGVCALTGGNQFCSRNCGSPLECNLKPECTTAGCCGEVINGCPAICATLDVNNCEISPQCPAECCTGECFQGSC